MQIVEEVQRNKLEVAADHLTKQFEQLKVQGFHVPDYLFDISGEIADQQHEKLKGINQKIKELKDDLMNATFQTLQRICRSEDEVSSALGVLFSKALTHTPEEIQRARERKERGNPPGKKAGPLGDQLTWEQLLSHAKGKSKLWIISRDSDYRTLHCDKRFLNPLLYQDLLRMNQPPPEVFCFDSIDEGIRDFVKATGVKAEKLPTLEESIEIREEEDSLPPLGWLSSVDDAYSVAIQHATRQRRFAAALMATMPNQGWRPGMPPDKPQE